MALQVRIDYSPVYEFIGSYMLYTHRKWIRSVDNGLSWARGVDSQVPEELRLLSHKLRNYSINEYDMLYAATLERHDPNSVPAFLDQLELMSVEDWHQMLERYGIMTKHSKLERMMTMYIPALRMWYESYFEASISEWEQSLIHDANEKMQLWRKMNPKEIIEVATNGVVFESSDPLHEVVLAPMWHYRPLNNTCMFKGRSLLLYAVDLLETDEEAPPLALKRMITALSDDKRLRILRFIAHQPATFAELLDHIQLGRSQLKHHLVILRSAGYLRTSWSGNVESISLRQEGFSDLSVFLEDYLNDGS
ncbi:ArsR/SmtB family transcription factor [Paenibacillus marinisediminis]